VVVLGMPLPLAGGGIVVVIGALAGGVVAGAGGVALLPGVFALGVLVGLLGVLALGCPLPLLAASPGCAGSEPQATSTPISRNPPRTRSVTTRT
jgi:hypothetical protein